MSQHYIHSSLRDLEIEKLNQSDFIRSRHVD